MSAMIDFVVLYDGDIWFRMCVFGSNGLIACVTNKDDPKTVALYLQLYEENCHGSSIIGRLTNVNAPNLISYANKMAVHWFNNLQEKFAKYVPMIEFFV